MGRTRGTGLRACHTAVQVVPLGDGAVEDDETSPAGSDHHLIWTNGIFSSVSVGKARLDEDAAQAIIRWCHLRVP